ncbi:MAG: hypothetical protein WA110_03290, partial [Anaerolineaceae bacterium]
MQKKSTFRVLAVLLIVGMLFSTVQSSSAMATQPSEVEQDLSKVETAVLDAISTKGASDYVIEMAEKADLTKAYDMKDWDERGWYVYDTLTEVAARTQKPVIDILEKSGVSYQSFFAGNEVAVFGGDLNSLSAIAGLSAVEHVRFPRTATIDPLENISKDLFNYSIDALDWGITDTNADDFWATYGMQGDGIVVASIDTGVQWNHPALDQSFKCGTNPSDPSCWADPSNTCGGSACDNNGHG